MPSPGGAGPEGQPWNQNQTKQGQCSPLTVTWEGRRACRLEEKGCGWPGRLAGVVTSFPGEGFPATARAGWGLVKSWRDRGTER